VLRCRRHAGDKILASSQPPPGSGRSGVGIVPLILIGVRNVMDDSCEYGDGEVESMMVFGSRLFLVIRAAKTGRLDI
jgi:hypothetical protein